MSHRPDPPAHVPPASGGEGPWASVRFRVDPDSEELLLALLPGHCLGVRVDDRGARREVVAYFASREIAVRAASELNRAVGAGLFESEEPEAVDDGRWVERFQAGLRPRPIGRRFTVRPDGSEGEGARIDLRLVPGRAFGTGEHPTTRLAVEALERTVESGTRWLDLGSGSGILAMVALHCGAEEVLGVDVDPVAVDVAREVLRLNGLERRISMRTGTLGTAGEAPWDGVVANVSATFFLENASELAAGITPSGWLIATGIPEPEAPAVAEALSRAGLETVERQTDTGWTLLVLRRKR